MRRVLSAGSAIVLAGFVALAGASGCASSGEGEPQKTRTTATTTHTVTATVEPTRTPTRPPPKPTHTPTSAAACADAATTVEAYFDAINARDFRRAWELGGKNTTDGSYASFVAGFANTAQDIVDILTVRGCIVTVTLDAVQTDGSVRSFAGAYTVRGGVIVGADIRQGSGPTEPTEPTGSPPGGLPPGPPPGPDLDCDDIGHPVDVGGGDPHHLDRDGDGIGCEES